MSSTDRADLDRADLSARGRRDSETFESVMGSYLERRSFLKGLAAIPVLTLPFAGGDQAQAQTVGNAPLTFSSIAENISDTVTVPPGYKTDVVIRWGDPLRPGLAPWDVNNQSPADQAQRFGFNCDMIALFPLQERTGKFRNTNSFLMCVNHEYTTGESMFPGYVRGRPTANQVRTEIEAHGVSVVRVRLMPDGTWTYDVDAPQNRRITGSTPIAITGPAAGDTLLRTPADPTGRLVAGTLNNCAGGYTPWGTYLTAEENFNQYFGQNNLVTDASIRALHAIVGVSTGASANLWESVDPRFNLSLAAGVNEPFRHGWIVEIDPYEPTSLPMKRTALGRFKHEAAETILAADGRVVVYTGDDERFEYVYKFISQNRVDPNDRNANMSLLDNGTLYVARFNDNGTGAWLPVTFEAVNAIAPGRFRNQADVLIRAREAGDVLGATPMDRPEDVEAPHSGNFRGNGKVYMVMTKNDRRVTSAASTGAQAAPRSRSALVNGPNPRGGASTGAAANVAGHIIEVTEAGNDHAALTFTWSIFMLGGDPANPAFALTPGVAQNVDVRLNGVATNSGARFACPDNIAFDSTGNLWIATDGNPDVFPCNDQVLATNVSSGTPKSTRRFLTGPYGSEICGPLMAPDDCTFFAAIQHPGEGGLINGPLIQPNTSTTTSTTGRTSNWPDGGNSGPRPSVIAVRRTDGGRVGS